MYGDTNTKIGGIYEAHKTLEIAILNIQEILLTHLLIIISQYVSHLEKQAEQ